MAANEPPDEKMHIRPDVVQWWLTGEHGLPPPWHPMEDRFVYRYFSEQTELFDWTSKNGLFLEQSRTNRELFDQVHNRKAFEDMLRGGSGLEYMVTGESQQAAKAPLGTKSGVWNIRKQDRQKRSENGARGTDEVEVLGTYYMIGAHVYQAPSVADVLNNRLLAATASLDKFMEKAASLPSWSPATGHTYGPTEAAKRSAGAATTGHNSPGASREASVASGTDPQSLRGASVVPEGVQPAAHAQTYPDARLLDESLMRAIQFADEYMDENPIIGEPGSFSFTSTAAAVKKRKADEEAALAAAKAREQKAASRATPTAIKAEPRPSPPAVMTESKTRPDKDRKGRSGDKKRRKSRANVQTPITPGTPRTVAPTPASST